MHIKFRIFPTIDKFSLAWHDGSMKGNTCIACFILFFLVLVPVRTVLAADLQSVTPLLYSVVQQQAALDKAFGSTDIKNLTPQQLLQGILAAQVAGTLPAIGGIATDGAQFKVTTGISGTAVGKIPAGTYAVTTQSLTGVAIILPSRNVTLYPSGANVIDIAMKLKSGGGAVSYRSDAWTWNHVKTMLTDAWNVSIDWLLSKSQKTMFPSTNLGDAVVVMRLYQDTNNNGVFDAKEQLVPWANVAVELSSTK